MNPKHRDPSRRPLVSLLSVCAFTGIGLIVFAACGQPSRLSSYPPAPKDPWHTAAPKAAAAGTASAKPIPPSIKKPLVFTDGTLKGVVTAAQIETIGHRPLFMEEGRYNDLIILKDELVTTPTLAEFSRALEKGGHIHTRLAVSMASDFVAGVGTWQFLRTAKPSRSSSFAPDWLRQLPVDIVHWHGSDEEEERERDALAGKTLADYRKSGHLISLTSSETSVEFSCGSREVEAIWLASGDLDHDGNEDRLLLLTTRAVEGSALGFETHVATHSPAKPSRIILRPFPEGNSVWH